MIKAILLLLSGLKFGKILFSGGTMLLSVFAYSFVFGWWYAAGFVLLILVHEMGHYIAARRCGLAVGLPTFIPFVGAWIQLKDLPHDVESEAYIGIAGPLVGTIGALAFYALARVYDSQLLLALAYAGCFLNLFNLIPLSPFDGGRVTAVISPRLWLLGVPILLALFVYRPSPLLVLVALLAAPQVLKAWRGISAEESGYYLASAEARMSYGLLYLGLVIFLALMCEALHARLPRAF